MTRKTKPQLEPSAAAKDIAVDAAAVEDSPELDRNVLLLQNLMLQNSEKPPGEDAEAKLSTVWNTPSLFAQFITSEDAFRPGLFALCGRSGAPTRGP